MSVATDLRVLDYGDHALLLECESTAEVLAFTAALREADLLGVTDIVPASRTVMVEVDGARYLPATRQRIEKLRVDPDDDVVAPGSADIVIDVVYDGADLDEVGRITGLGAAGVVARTPGRRGGWRSADSPISSAATRADVPAATSRAPGPDGCARRRIQRRYPRETPGGWQLIGRTDAALWDIDRADPALLSRA